MRKYRAKIQQQTPKSAAAKRREEQKRKNTVVIKSAEKKAAVLEKQVAKLRARQWRLKVKLTGASGSGNNRTDNDNVGFRVHDAFFSSV